MELLMSIQFWRTMEEGSVSMVRGYPENLEAIGHNPFDYDCHEYYEELLFDRKRLFGDDGEITVRVTEIGSDSKW